MFGGHGQLSGNKRCRRPFRQNHAPPVWPCRRRRHETWRAPPGRRRRRTVHSLPLHHPRTPVLARIEPPTLSPPSPTSATVPAATTCYFVARLILSVLGPAHLTPVSSTRPPFPPFLRRFSCCCVLLLVAVVISPILTRRRHTRRAAAAPPAATGTTTTATKTTGSSEYACVLRRRRCATTRNGHLQ